MSRKLRNKKSDTEVDSVGQSVACNGLIVENILKYLEPKDLIIMRSVTILWRTLATEKLQKDHMLEVDISDPLEFHELEKLICTGSFPAVLHVWNLRELMNPDEDTQAQLDKENDVSTHSYPAYLQNQVKLLSSKISKFSKGLRITFRPSLLYEGGLAQRLNLLNTLFHEYVNIEELDLTKLLFDKEDVIPHNFQFAAKELPNLKRIRFPQISSTAQKNFFKHIVSASPNIKNFEMLSIYAITVLDLLMECGSGKTDCVKHLEILPSWLESSYLGHLEILKRFTDCRPKLLSITLIEDDFSGRDDLNRETWAVVRRALLAFFVATSNTLEMATVPELTFLDYRGESSNMNAACAEPAFEKLRVLELKNDRWPVFRSFKAIETCILSRTVSPATCFPNLVEVKIDFGEGCVERNLQFSSKTVVVREKPFYQFPTVKKLQVKCRYGVKDLEILSSRFPNMKELTFTQEVDKVVRLPNEFRGLPDSLESLTIIFTVSYYNEEMEETFTKLLTSLGKNELEILTVDRNSSGTRRKSPKNTMRNTRSSLKGLKNRRVIFDVEGYLQERKRAMEPRDPRNWTRLLSGDKQIDCRCCWGFY